MFLYITVDVTNIRVSDLRKILGKIDTDLMSHGPLVGLDGRMIGGYELRESRLPTPPDASPDGTISKSVADFIRAGEMIKAIKQHRINNPHLTLKECKDAVEAARSNHCQ